jgi:hypothetical protein
MIKKTKATTRRSFDSEGFPIVSRQSINVSELDLLGLSLVNAEGEELLKIDFDRLADEKPVIKIDVPTGPDFRRMKTGLVLFDVNG